MVSIVIPTYNREKTISRALESALNQTYKDFEIIVVDDNSSDNTDEVMKEYCDKYSNITYIKHKVNKGGSGARNTGVKNSKGSIIAFLDSDDEFADDKLEKCVDVFNKRQDVGLIYTDVYFISEITGHKYISERQDWNESYKDLLRNNIIGGTSSIVIRKEVFDKAEGFDETLPSCQDWDFYIRALKNCNAYRVAGPLTKYYVHEDSISGNKDKAIKGHLHIMQETKEILKGYNNKKLYKIIISEQYITIAQIYSNFSDYNNAKKYYFESLKMNLLNKKALKNSALTLLGEKKFLETKRKAALKKNSLLHAN